MVVVVVMMACPVSSPRSKTKTGNCHILGGYGLPMPYRPNVPAFHSCSFASRTTNQWHQSTITLLSYELKRRQPWRRANQDTCNELGLSRNKI